MRVLSLFTLLILLSFPANAQDSSGVKRYLLVSEANTLHFSGVELYDGYLSPLYYNGISVRYENDRQRLFSPGNRNVSMQSKINITGAITRNPSYTALMSYLHFNYAWGSYYHFRFSEKIQLLVGGLVDAGIGAKLLSRNVNNPFNIDFSMNINAGCILQCKIPSRKRENLLLQIGFHIPLIGFMFVPGFGASYYEIGILGDFSDCWHFSSFHNKFGLTQSYTIDIPFKKSTWRFGLSSQILKYKANDMFFKKKDFALVIGWRRELYSFKGYKRTAPANFIDIQP